MRIVFLIFVINQLCVGFEVFLCANHHFYIEEKSDNLTSLQFGEGGVVNCVDYGKLSELEVRLVELPFNCVTKVSEEGMKSVMKMCPKIEKNKPTLDFWKKIKFSIVIYPGTLWCGSGNISDSNQDVGVLKLADSCCRTHDHCPDNIEVGKSKYGITNHQIGTVSNCQCDDEFHECLSKIELPIADNIGFLFFDVIAQPCFKNEYPIVKCLKNAGLLGQQCQEYQLNTTAEKRYQLFDAKIYYPTTLKRLEL